MHSPHETPTSTVVDPAATPGAGRVDAVAAAGVEPGANLDKVRDILFGANMRDYDRRFARLEERLVKETTTLNDEVRRRLTALEEFVRRETETLAERIRTEFEERSEATAAISRDLRDTAGALQRRAGALDDQLGRTQRELRQQMLEQYQRLTDELREKVDEVVGRITRESQELRSDKADRATIATLLTEMAMRLTNELTVPGFEPPQRG